jgi:hypothetical protein
MADKTVIKVEKSVRQDSIKWWYSLSIDEQYEHANNYHTTKDLNVSMITPSTISMMWFKLKKEEEINSNDSF